MDEPDNKVTWRVLYHELVDAVIRAVGAVKKGQIISHINKADGILISKALQLLGKLVYEFYSIAPDPNPSDYDKQITTEADVIRQKMKEQIELIEGIIERAEAL